MHWVLSFTKGQPCDRFIHPRAASRTSGFASIGRRARELNQDCPCGKGATELASELIVANEYIDGIFQESLLPSRSVYHICVYINGSAARNSHNTKAITLSHYLSQLFSAIITSE